MHISHPHRTSRSRKPAPQRKALPLYLSMALAAGGMLCAPAHAGMAGGMAVPGANTGTVSVSALTSPTGGTVVGGLGSISQDGSTTVINQLSNKLALDWQTFNVGKDATVLFKQPSFTAVALNRILDQNPSQIFGRINSNGQVFLINTHGIIFGSTAQVNVGGLMASTLDLTPTDFLANHFNLDAHGGSAGVVNHGTIAAASGGSVSLVGGSVANDGLILANYGNINLDGADKAVLDFDGNGLINIQVTGELKQRLDANAAVSNSGTLQANGGTVVLQAAAAKDLFTDVVNNSGVITAGGINTDGGTVRLVAAGGDAINSGDIDATGTRGGTVQLLSDANVGVTGGSIDASGTLGGGSIRIGGGYQGGEGLTTAQATYVAPGASLHADATQRGQGGSVVVWGDQVNNFYGSITARGGVLGGDGGLVETSSHDGLNAQGSVDASASHGAAGTWLLDPHNVEIVTGGSGTLTSGIFSAAADNSTIDPTTIGDALTGGTSVTVFTGASGTQAGNITLTDAITATGTGSLYLKAAGSILLNNSISAVDGTTPLNVHLWANYGGTAGATSYAAASGSGAVSIGGAITTGGGDVDIRTSDASHTGGALTIGAGGSIDTAGATDGALTVKTNGISEDNGSTIVAGDATLDTGNALASLNGANDFGGTVNLAGSGSSAVFSFNNGSHALTLGGVVTNGGDISVSAGGGITLGSAVDTGTGSQSYGNAVTLTGGTVLTGNTITFMNTVTGNGDALTVTGNASFSGTVQLGSLQVTGTSALNGSITTSGTQTYQGAITLGGDTTLTANDTITLADVDGAYALTLDAGVGAVTLGGTIGGTALTSLDVSGSGGITLAGNVATSGAQTYHDALALGGDAVLTTTDSAVDFQGTVDSTPAAALTVNAGAGNVTFGGAVGGTGTLGDLVVDSSGSTSFAAVDAASVTTDVGGTTTLGGNVTTSGVQHYHDAVNLGGDVVLASTGSGTIGFDGTVDGAYALAVNTAGATTFGGAIGGNTPLTSLTTDAGGGTTLATGVSTSGDQSYGDALTLGGDVTLTSGNGTIGLANVDGAHALIVDAGTGNVVLGGTIGVSSLAVTGAGGIDLGGDVTTTGGQSYADAVTLTADSTLHSTGNGAIGFGSTLDGAHALTVTTGGALSFTGAIGGGTALSGLDTTSSAFGAGSTLAVDGDLAVTTTAGAIGQNAAFTVTGMSSFDAGTQAITLTSVGNDFGGAVNLTGGATQITDQNALTLGTLATDALTVTSTGALDLGSGSVDGDLTATSNGGAITEEIGGVQVSGTSDLQAGGGEILLTDGGNHFTGAVTAAGQGVTLVDAGDLSIASLSSGTNGTVNLTAGGALTLPASGIDTGTADLTLAANGGSLAMPGALSGHNVTLIGRDGITLGSDLTGTGTVTLTSNLGAIDQTGGVLTAGTLTGSSALATTLGDANLIGQLGNFTAANFSLVNAQALTVSGAIDGGSSTTIDTSGNLTLSANVSGTSTTLDAGGTIDQTAGIVTATTLNLDSVGGASLTQANQVTNLGTVANTGMGGLVLTNGTGLNLSGPVNVGTASGNDLSLDVSGNLTQSGGSVITAAQLIGNVTGDATLGGSNLIGTLGSFSADNLSLTNAQTLTVNGPLTVPGTLSLTTTAGALSLGTDLAATTVTLDSAGALTLSKNITATTLSLSSGGAIAQTAGALSVSGTTDVNAGTQAITLISVGNDFGGAVNLTGGATQITDQNALTLGTLATDALTVTSTGALDLGSGSVDGDLTATSNGGAITEEIGGVQVSGTSDLQAGGGEILLTDGGNHFAGAVTAAGQGVQLQDAGDLTIAALSSGTNGTVNLTAGGALNLPASGIDTGTADLTLAANGGSLAMPGALSGANVTLIGRDGISLGNNLSSAGTVTLNSSNGAISQSGGVITAGTLTGSSHANTTLNQANLVGQLGNFTAANFSLVNAQALAVTGVISTVGGSDAISLTTTSGALDVQQALSGGAITLDSAGSLALATNITGSTVTLTSDGNISQSGGVIQAGTLTGSAAGSATLTKANKIGTLGNFSSANGLALSNGQALTVSGTVDGGSSTQLTTTAGTLTAGGTIKGDAIALAGQGGLAINGTVNAGAGDIALASAGGAITEGSAGTLIGGGLSGTSAGAMSLGGANQIVTLGNITTGGDFSFRDTRTLTVNSPLTINGGNGNLSLTTTGSTSDLILATDLSGRTVALVAGRDINQAGSAIHATTLTGSAGRDAHFTGANHIGALGDFTASSLVLDNAQALNVTGSVSTGSGALSLATTSGKLTLTGHVSGGATTLDAAGDMALNGALFATSLALQSGGAIAEGSGGVITASSLTGSATGAAALNGANHVGTLGSFNADGFQFTNAGALTVSGPIDGGSNTRLATTAGDLAVNGRVSGTSTELVSAGAITQGSGGKVVAGTLTGQSTGATTLTGANSIDTLGTFRAAGLSLSNGKTLVVSGPVDGGASAVLTTTAGDLSVAGALSASAVRLVSAGALSESSGGAITAGTLSGQAAGTTSLGTSSAPAANHIGTLGNFSSTAGFSLTNAQTLTLGSVDGSSFTIDAGHAALYLGVTGGDLLQSGTTPLYDGAGTFFSSGKMGTAKDPIYVIGDSGQVIADVGAPPAYFYALDRQGNILPLTGDLSFNVPTSLFFGKAQNGNGRGDAYIDPSVISANYRSFGIVPSGILLPEDQQQCQPELEDCSSE